MLVTFGLCTTLLMRCYLMNCWKTINLSRDLGNHRLTSFSLLVTIAAFIIMYLPLSIINESITLNDDHMLLFIISLFIIAPIHIACHAIPAWLTLKKAEIKIIKTSYLLPAITIKYVDSLSKSLKIASILAPTLFLTLPLIICAVLFPNYMHYFTMSASFNIGLSVIDFIYLVILIKAPRKCFVDHTNSTFDILIKG